ncbi:MAG: HxsD-like protein [Acidobacteriota bacterium]|nr:HxsD-like protein [Acidobacteriota bacterium]
MNTQVALSSAIYPSECLRQAAAAYHGLCSVRIVKESPSGYSIEISRSADVADGEQLVNEFLNYLLDLSLEKYLSELQGADGTDRVQTA